MEGISSHEGVAEQPEGELQRSGVNVLLRVAGRLGVIVMRESRRPLCRDKVPSDSKLNTLSSMQRINMRRPASNIAEHLQVELRTAGMRILRAQWVHGLRSASNIATQAHTRPSCWRPKQQARLRFSDEP